MILISLNEALLTIALSCGGHNFIPNGGFISTANTALNFTFKGPCIVKYMPIIVQQDISIYRLFISVNRSTCFGWYFHPSSGAHVNVSTAPGISKTVTVTWLDGNCSSRPVTFTTVCIYGFTNARCCGYIDMSSWLWVEIPPEACRAVYIYK